jgi:hypothetical protein
MNNCMDYELYPKYIALLKMLGKNEAIESMLFNFVSTHRSPKGKTISLTIKNYMTETGLSALIHSVENK